MIVREGLVFGLGFGVVLLGRARGEVLGLGELVDGCRVWWIFSSFGSRYQMRLFGELLKGWIEGVCDCD